MAALKLDLIKNYLMGEKLPNSFNKTTEHFKKHKHDKHSKNGLIAMVNLRKKLLKS